MNIKSIHKLCASPENDGKRNDNGFLLLLLLLLVESETTLGRDGQQTATNWFLILVNLDFCNEQIQWLLTRLNAM